METQTARAQSRELGQVKMARKLSTTRRRWLLTAHILLSVAWLGTAISSLVLYIAAGSAHDGTLLLGTYVSADILDSSLVRPLAVGAAATGVVLSRLTQWGLFRHSWIAAKLIVTILLIVSGVLIYGPFRASRSVISIVSNAGLQAWQNPTFRSNQTLLLIFVITEVVLLSASVAISVFKPTGHKRQIDDR